MRLAVANKTGYSAISRVASYNMEFLIVQAYRIIVWRTQPEQLAKANTSGINTSYNTYVARLRALKDTAEKEAFQASRRVLSTIGELMRANRQETAEFFLPGECHLSKADKRCRNSVPCILPQVISFLRACFYGHLCFWKVKSTTMVGI